MSMIPQQLSGNVKCTTFGCYVAVNKPTLEIVRYNFSPTSLEGNCSTPVISPTNTFTLSSSPTLTSIISSSSHMLEIYTTITENHLSYATVLSTSLSTTNFVSSAAPMTSFVSSVAPTTNLGSSAAPTTSFGSSAAPTTSFGSSAAPTTSFVSSAAPTTSFGSSAAPTTSFGSSVASTPPNNMPRSHSLHIMGLLLLAPFSLLSFSLLMCISITVKRWRKNKLLKNRRTGYGLHKYDTKVYECISDVFLDMTFILPKKYSSAISIIDPFHFKSAELALSDTQSDDGTIDSAIESEMQHTIAAAPTFTFSEPEVCIEQATDTSIDPSSYITALAYNDGECMTHSEGNKSTSSMISAGADHDSTDRSVERMIPSLRKDKVEGGYIEALTYTSNESINNVEQQNDTSVSPSKNSYADNHTTSAKDAGYIQIPPVVQSQNGPSTQSTKDGYVFICSN
ncbi:uncharacterized protein LOC135340639 isoform X2 [Halichondria panicea]